MYMISALRPHFTGLCIAFSTVALVACSDSNSSVSLENSNSASESDTQTAGSNSETSTAGVTTIAGTDNTDTNQTDSTSGNTGGESTTDGNTTTGSTENNQPDNTPTEQPPTTTDPVTPPPTTDPITDEGSTDDNTVPAIATGSDVSGNDDDSPTATESASRVGAFIKDTSRSAGPPSVPEGLTLLLSGETWLEFSWMPSSDDQSVEEYEIYRDGTLVQSIRGDTSNDNDYRSWITTSYTDCNYTRYNCENNPISAGSSYEYRVVAVDNEGMKSAPSEPAVFQMAVRESGSADLSNYVQVFSEEFNGDGLNRTKWKTALPWGPNDIINGERQYFANIFGNTPPPVDPFVFTGSTLQITGTVTPTDALAQSNQQPYTSGVITTSDNFKMTYGYVEMSAKVTSGEGFLSTFYLFNQDYEKNKPEIDIIEYIGNRPDKAFQTYHYFDSNRARWSDGERHSSPTMETVTGADLSTGFHTYSVLWEPGLVVWYIDGSEVRRLTGVRVSDEPMNIIAQLVIGSEWIGNPDASSLPKTFEIDYIRAWQQQ